jgi:hypothetical protein
MNHLYPVSHNPAKFSPSVCDFLSNKSVPHQCQFLDRHVI